MVVAELLLSCLIYHFEGLRHLSSFDVKGLRGRVYPPHVIEPLSELRLNGDNPE